MNRPGRRAQRSRPRIMIVIARLNIGGPASHVVLLAEGLARRGYEVDLVCGAVPGDEGDMTYYATARGIRPHIVPGLQRAPHPLHDLRALVGLIRWMRTRRPAVVHTHTAKAGFVGRWAARIAGVETIVHTYHGHVFHSYFGRTKTAIFRWLECRTAAITDAVITLSEGLRDDVAGRYRVVPPDRVHVIPLGLDLSSPDGVGAAAIRDQHGIVPGAPWIGIIGRLVAVKNHDLFLRAARRVRDHLPEARFLIVGDGELRGRLERLAHDLGLGAAVRFTGWIRDVTPLYRALDLVVISSRNEGTPVSLIEALAAGCPVVATDVGGVADLLRAGRWGRLVPSEDEEGLARAMIAALRRPPDMATVSPEVRRHHDVDLMVRDTAKLYERIAPTSRGARC